LVPFNQMFRGLTLSSKVVCTTQGIQVQHYVHTQNGLAISLIKRIKLIARLLLHNCNLPISYWGHAVLHATDLI
jgi:hypothetical protein